MNVRNCAKCGRLFNYVAGAPLCMSCRDENEKKFQDVKKYVEEHRHSGIQEVSQECEVEVRQIQQWIREERLAFADDSPIGINCERCGAMIRTGRFCEKCKKEVMNDLGSVSRRQAPQIQPRKTQKDDPRMRFLDRQ
ncbi:MAG: flagellar protein [Lachnospiraceae bacterium]